MESGSSGTSRGRSVLIHEFVTGGGFASTQLPPSLADEGGAMRRALAEDFAAVPGVRVAMTLDRRLPDEPGPWDLVRVGPGQELDAFARLAADADYTLVIAPESGGILFDRARILERAGGRSLGCTPAAIAEAGNKLVCFDRFRAAGVRTPLTRAVGPRDGWPRRITFPLLELAASCPFVEVPEPMADLPPSLLADAEIEHPAILKPVDGAGSEHTFLLAGRADWPDPDWEPEVAVLQPWIDGQARSVSLLIAPDGRPAVLGFASQRTRVDRGRISYLGGLAPLPFTEEQLRMVSRVVRALPGLRGWVGIDFIDDGEPAPIAIEVNPRPTTSVVAFRSLLGPGVLAAAWLGLFEGPSGPPLDALFDRVRDRLDRPLAFDPDGTIRHPRTGPEP